MSLKMNTPLKLLNYILKHLKTSLMKNMILLKSFVQTPKKLQHEELIGNIPEEWILEDIVEEDKIENTEIRDIIREGPNIRLRMNSSHSIRIPNYWNKEEISPRHSIDNFVINDEVIGINNNRPHIATSFYGTENNYSPTTSQILGVITKEKPFEIDKNWISKDFYTTTSWKTSTGQTIESQYPPKETIKLQVAHNLELEATLYKYSGIEGSVDKRDTKKLERIEHKHEQLKPIEKPIYKFQSPDVIKLRTNVEADINELKEKLKSISLE
ncbi:hypothetical protein AHAS_Ahas14G0133200 [Arachis hypogaea]